MEAELNKVLNELQWYASVSMRDKGNRLPVTNKSMGEITEPWEAVYWTIETIKNSLNEELQCTENTRTNRKEVVHM